MNVVIMVATIWETSGVTVNWSWTVRII